jgi:hypothetical protein
MLLIYELIVAGTFVLFPPNTNVRQLAEKEPLPKYLESATCLLTPSGCMRLK